MVALQPTIATYSELGCPLRTGQLPLLLSHQDVGRDRGLPGFDPSCNAISNESFTQPKSNLSYSVWTGVPTVSLLYYIQGISATFLGNGDVFRTIFPNRKPCSRRSTYLPLFLCHLQKTEENKPGLEVTRNLRMSFNIHRIKLYYGRTVNTQ